MQQVKYNPVKKKVEVQPLKTRSSRRRIEIGPRTKKILEEYRRYQDLQKKVMKRWQENNLVFPSTKGTPKDARNLTRGYKDRLVAAGLPRDIPFHALRHTHASLLLNMGEPTTSVRERLGHSNAQTTLEMYGHLEQTTQRNAAIKIDLLLADKLDIDELGSFTDSDFGAIFTNKSPAR